MKFKIGEVVIYNNAIYMIQDSVPEFGSDGPHYLLDDGRWYPENELI